MLGLALLLSAAFNHSSNVALETVKPLAVASCPSVPGVPFVSNAQPCSALDITGRIDGAVVLDPAYEVVVPASQLSRPGRADAVLSGFGADGRSLFTLPFEANGPFHLYVPLASSVARSITRLHLSSAAGSSEQVPVPHGEPDAEVIAVDGSHVLLAWNARAFPAIRIGTVNGAAPVAVGVGKSTYQELTFASSARAFVVDFSDGVHSMERTFRVFGRS